MTSGLYQTLPQIVLRHKKLPKMQKELLKIANDLGMISDPSADGSEAQEIAKNATGAPEDSKRAVDDL